MTQQPPPEPQDPPQDSPYAAPPASPYGPPPQAYGPPPAYPYPPSAPPMAPYGPQGVEVYAHWGRRVGASLLDSVYSLPAVVLVIIGAIVIAATSDSRGRATSPGYGIGITLVILGYVAAIGLQIWNRCFVAGRTGQSWGKKIIGIRLVAEATGQPIGAGMAFLRELAHVVDGFFYLGYLWPLWDAKRQTFADKICSTVVLAH